MFWTCFTFDKREPCHCWTPETKQEKEEAANKIEELNKELELLMREKWELETGMERLDLHTKPGKKPQWTWNQKNGNLTRERLRH